MAQTDVIAAKPGQTTVSAAGRRKFLSAENPWLWIAPTFIILFAYSIGPLIFNLITSFNEWSTSRKLFRAVGLQNWEKMLGLQLSNSAALFQPSDLADPRFGNSLAVTLTYTVAALVIQLVLGLVIALLLDSKPWASNVMQTLLILPMVTAPAVAGLIFRLLEHSEFGVISWIVYGIGATVKSEPLLGGSGKNALLGLLIVDIWQWTPFFTLIILAGLKGLPTEVMEAAQVDGASWSDRLTRIKIPLLFGVITVAILFRLVDLFKVFDYVVIMTSGGPATRTETISYYGYVNTFQLIKWGYGAAIGVFIMLMGWVSAYAYQRIFRVTW